MKNLIALILILFSTNTFAASGSGNISTVTTLGGVNTTDNLFIPNSNPSGYFSIYGASSITGGNVLPLYKNGVIYQVPNGKTFVANKICIASGAANSRAQVLTATASFAANATPASLTGPVYQGGASTVYTLDTPPTALLHACFSVTYNFAQNTYVGMQGLDTTSNAIIITGKEI